MSTGIRRALGISVLGVALVLALLVPLHVCPSPIPCLHRPCPELMIPACHPSGAYQTTVLVVGLLVALPLLLWRGRPLKRRAEQAHSVG